MSNTYNFQTDPIDGCTITLGQRRLGSNCIEGLTLNSPENWSLTTGFSLVSYLGHLFVASLTPLWKIRPVCSKPYQLSDMHKCFLNKYVKLMTLVKGDLKAPFSIATTPRCRGRCYSIPRKVKLATLVEGDPKAPFIIATTPRCRRGRYSILRKVKLETVGEGVLLHCEKYSQYILSPIN